MWILTTWALLSIQPYVATSQVQLDWSIARDLAGKDTPNILSELEFERVQSRELGVSASIASEARGSWQLLLEGDGAYGWIDRGTTIDSDYFGDNRTGLYSRSRATITGDNGYALRGGGGIAYQLVPDRHTVQAIFGVYRQVQTLNFQSGRQLVADATVYSGSELNAVNTQLQHELDTHYRTEWQGNYLSLGYQWYLQKWSSAWRMNYLQGRYYGEGHWNLRDDFQQPRSFSHYVNSTGVELLWTLNYEIGPQWNAYIGLMHQHWQSDTGVGVSYLADGSINATRFNGVSWQVNQTRVGVSYRF